MKNYPRKTTVIFDFDGTLANSLPLFVNAYNSIAKSSGLSAIDASDVKELRTKTPFEVMKKLHISLIKAPYYLWQGRKYIRSHQHELEVIPGIPETIRMLAAEYRLGILTSNDKAVVNDFLKRHDMEHFAFVEHEFNIFGKDRALAKLMRSYGFQKENVLYIGDEVRDIEACKKANVSVCGVIWGLNDEHVLRSYSPNHVASTLEELYKVIMSYS